jgi:sulfate permease, SulP family
VQIAGPTAAFMPIVLLIIERYGYDGLLLATIMAGVMLVVMGLARMGAVIKFIPYPVTSGFTTGIAVSIMVSQVPGLPRHHRGRAPAARVPGQDALVLVPPFRHQPAGGGDGRWPARS